MYPTLESNISYMYLSGEKTSLYQSILKGSDDGVLQSGLWVPGLCPSSGILKNTTFRKLDLFSSSGVGKRGTYSVGSWTSLCYYVASFFQYKYRNFHFLSSFMLHISFLCDEQLCEMLYVKQGLLWSDKVQNWMNPIVLSVQSPNEIQSVVWKMTHSDGQI
jgi:hypothetical protein